MYPRIHRTTGSPDRTINMNAIWVCKFSIFDDNSSWMWQSILDWCTMYEIILIFFLNWSYVMWYGTWFFGYEFNWSLPTVQCGHIETSHESQISKLNIAAHISAILAIEYETVDSILNGVHPKFRTKYYMILLRRIAKQMKIDSIRPDYTRSEMYFIGNILRNWLTQKFDWHSAHSKMWLSTKCHRTEHPPVIDFFIGVRLCSVRQPERAPYHSAVNLLK